VIRERRLDFGLSSLKALQYLVDEFIGDFRHEEKYRGK
jgi:hypothetical protein